MVLRKDRISRPYRIPTRFSRKTITCIARLHIERKKKDRRHCPGVFFHARKLVRIMLKSCSYCGKIHDSKFICPKKPIRKKRTTEQSKFRSSYAWTKKALAIKKRDGYLCQICIRGLFNPKRKYESRNLEVHHIERVADCYEKRLDGRNLITTCECHHEMADAGLIPVDLLKKIAGEQELGCGVGVTGTPPGVEV